MYKNVKTWKTSIKRNTSYVGDNLEVKIFKIVNNKEPIVDGAPLIYTERSQGVQPDYDIRTDRFEIALEAMDKITKSHIAKRENKPTIGEQAKDGMSKEGESGQPSPSI